MPAAAPSADRPLTPHEEQFWQRYSPHHEFPLSSATSIALHVLALVLLALLGWWLARQAIATRSALPELPVHVLPGKPGGAPSGDGSEPTAAGGDPRAEDVGPKAQVNKEQAEIPRVDLGQPRIAEPEQTENKGELERLIKESQRIGNESERITKENREKLRRGLARLGRADKSGPGGGGKDGKDGGSGNRTGPGPGTLEERERRMGRWVMVFDTYNGEDYARQLAGLGAFLGIPVGKGDSVSYKIIRDLKARPVAGDVEDLADIGRIQWTDERPESIAPLCRALNIHPVPDHLLAFFPIELEQRLLRLELRYKGLREDQIRETRFKIRKTADGYEPMVIEQKAN
jgi:hypothetical protein